MDIFGFKNQGINYDKFRPRYPPSFIDRYATKMKGKGRYLDIATGTGQLLFAFAKTFSFNKGVDISPQMIETSQIKAKQFMTENPQNKLQLEVGGVMDMNEAERYDFITVGQALHFFPIESSLNKIKSMLKDDGTFVTFGYIIKTAKSKNEKEGEVFHNFYSKVKPLFTFDRDELHNHYSDKEKYPFEKIFPKVEKEIIEVPLEMNKMEYLSYLKTMSGYNLYLQQKKEDPLIEVEKNCAEEVTLLLDYFRIESSLK